MANLDTIRQEIKTVHRPSIVDYIPADTEGKGQKVLIVTIGTNFMEGVTNSIVAASQEYMKVNHAPCDIFLLQSLTVLPPLGLGEMRNLAIMKAYLEGYSHVMLIDNDVILAPDTIVKLTARGKGFIVPHFEQVYQEGKVGLIHWPMFCSGQGLRELAWTVPFCILYDMQIFHSGQVDVRCHTPTMLYNEDEINSVYLKCKGVTLWQDTDAKVKLLRGPRLLCETLKELKIVPPYGMPK